MTKYLVIIIALMLSACNSETGETVEKTHIRSIYIPNISESVEAINGLILQVEGIENINNLESILFYVPGNTSCKTDEVGFYPYIDNNNNTLIDLSLSALQGCIGDISHNITLKMQLTFTKEIDWGVLSTDLYIKSYVYDVAGEIIRFTNGLDASYNDSTGRIDLPMPYSGLDYDFIYYPNYTFKFSDNDTSGFIASFGINGGMSINSINEWNFSYDSYDYLDDQWFKFYSEIPTHVEISSCYLTSRTTGAVFNCPW
jgi:hypothetical protein